MSKPKKISNVFLDTNILLDVFLDRAPFSQPAQVLWTKVTKGLIRAAISALSISHVFYIIQKNADIEKAHMATEALLTSFDVVEINKRLIGKAMDMKWPDFEDSLQFLAAKRWGAKAIITRDLDGFAKSTIPVMETSHYLALLEEVGR